MRKTTGKTKTFIENGQQIGILNDVRALHDVGAGRALPLRWWHIISYVLSTNMANNNNWI
jgi:hypothetical protein